MVSDRVVEADPSGGCLGISMDWRAWFTSSWFVTMFARFTLNVDSIERAAGVTRCGGTKRKMEAPLHFVDPLPTLLGERGSENCVV